MEFLVNHNISPPKNLYPCLATITIAPGPDRSRRQSTSSNAGAGEDDNVLKRIASGGRRKSDASQRRKSFVASGGGIELPAGGTAASKDRGTWYWRVQAGVTDNALVLLPLTQPANPLLTSAPIPLSAAMPAHSVSATGQNSSHDDDTGLVDKVKNLFRRGSAVPTAHTEKAIPHPDPATTQSGDKVLDQTAQGEQLPSASANAAGATNVNANAESGWPGVIDGEKLKAVAVPIHTIEKGKVSLHGGKKGEAYYITVPITSHFASMIAGFAEAGPQAKSGSIKLEFDKDWIGAKGESELLHYQLTSAISEPRSPATTQLQLGGGGAGADTNHPHSGFDERHGGARRSSQVGPGETTSAAVAGVESESLSSGRKVAGEQ